MRLLFMVATCMVAVGAAASRPAIIPPAPPVRATLGNSYIFGTHDSGSYRYQEPFEYTPNNRALGLLVSVIDQLNPRFTSEYVHPILVNQGLDIYHQLLHGARFLDVRLAFHAGTNTWFTFHTIFGTVTLEDICYQIRLFFNENRREILIVNLEDIVGGALDVQAILVDYLGDRIFTPDDLKRLGYSSVSALPLDELQGRVLVMTSQAQQHPSIFPTANILHNNLAHAKTTSELRDYYSQTVPDNQRIHLVSWIVSLELGDVLESIVALNVSMKSIEKYAHELNPALVRMNWATFQPSIIVLDFFQFDDIAPILQWQWPFEGQ